MRTDRRTDKLDEANSLFSQFGELVLKRRNKYFILKVMREINAKQLNIVLPIQLHRFQSTKQ